MSFKPMTRIAVLWDAENIHPRNHLGRVRHYLSFHYGTTAMKAAQYRMAYAKKGAHTKSFKARKTGKCFIPYTVKPGPDAADRKLIELARSFRGDVIVLATNDRILIEAVELVKQKHTELVAYGAMPKPVFERGGDRGAREKIDLWLKVAA